MNTHERGFSQPPKQNVERAVSDLSVGSKVMRNGETRTIESYRQTGAGIEIIFDNKEYVMLDGDDTLEVPAS